MKIKRAVYREQMAINGDVNQKQESVQENSVISVKCLQSYIQKGMRFESAYRLMAIGILLSGFGIRLMGLDKGIWLDEYDSLRVAFSSDFLQQLQLYDHPPLYFVLLRLWSLISIREEFLRLLSVFFGIGTVAVVMKWVKQHSHLGSLLAGFYCATLPIMLRYSQEIRDYSLLLFATALSFFFASRILAEPEKLSGYLGLAFSLSAAVATHLVGVMLLLSIFMYMIITSPALGKSKRILLSFAAPLCVFLLLFFFFLQETKKDPATWWMPAISLNLILTMVKSVLGVSEASQFFETLQNSLPVLRSSVVALIKIVVAGLGIGLLVAGSWKRSLPLLAGAMAYWIQLIIYSILVLPIFWYRTFLPGMIPFIGFIGLQIATIHMRKLKILAVILLILICVVFAMNWISSEAGKPYEEWREISQSLKSAWQPDDVVIFYPDYVEGPVRYYVDLPSKAIISLPVDADMRKVDEEISRIVKQNESSAVFLIVRSDLLVQKHAENYQYLLAYLESEFGQPSFTRKFGLLSISKYELPEFN
jgi:hypothetical protein